MRTRSPQATLEVHSTISQITGFQSLFSGLLQHLPFCGSSRAFCASFEPVVSPAPSFFKASVSFSSVQIIWMFSARENGDGLFPYALLSRLPSPRR